MYRVAVVGDTDSISGFLALGIDTFAVYSGKETQEILTRLSNQGYSVIYITENAASDAMETIDKFKNQLVPAIIMIPGNTGSLGLGMLGIKKSVERAVGADILG